VRTLSEPYSINVTGCLLAIGLAPIFVHIDSRRYLAIFSTETKLRDSMKFHKVEHYTIKKISNGGEFLECLWAQHIDVVLDPHLHDGNVRFKLLKPYTRSRLT